jgi:hypothetical protein
VNGVSTLRDITSGVNLIYFDNFIGSRNVKDIFASTTTVQKLIRSKINREAEGQGEFSVGLAARRDASPMSRHNQQRSVEEGRSLLGGNHAIKSVKPSADILESLLTGVNMGVSAPHLIHKWLNKSRQSPSFML